MTGTDRLQYGILVGKGYFPEELPPCFTTEDLQVIVGTPGFNTERYINDREDRRFLQSSKTIHFSIPQIKGYRRILGLPGPFHYIQLAQTLIVNRREISTKIGQSHISIFKNYSSTNTSARYIDKPDFKSFIEKRILMATGYRYLLMLDVTRFYSSIYTHSIPWAIHTKEISKGNDSPSLFGNLIDKHCRQCQDRQTMGLPIGPDSSRIISEIILAAVDKQLQENLTEFKGIRNVDDYFLYFKSYADAEKGRTLLQKFLREYELELNLSKEKIIELPEIIESEWKATIRNFRFRDKEEHERADLINFFDMNFAIARKFPDDMILTYSIAKLRGLHVHKNNWKLLEAFLLNSIVLEPKVVQQVIYLLLINEDHSGFELNWDKIKEALESFISFHNEHDHHFEIVWALWYFLKTGLMLSASIVQELNTSTNDLVILLLLGMEKKELLEIPLNKTEWQSLLTKENLVSEHWLLAYEGVAGEYLSTNRIHIDEVPFFAMIFDKDVRFFKSHEDTDEDIAVSEPKSSLAKELETSENRRRRNEDDDREDLPED